MSAKVAFITMSALVCVAAVVEAAGGIKGQESQQRPLGLKGPALRAPPQQNYLPPPPPPPAALPIGQRPVAQAIKGPGQVAPVFSAARVQQPIVQQQQQIIQQQEQEPEGAGQQQIVQQVVQQQQEEIDPNAAAQDNAPAVVAPARAAAAPAASEEEANPRPEPYNFQYAFESGDSATSGSSQREESQDASGRITGFYTLRGDDGRDRRVDYVADASGFRATISTNEMGTSPKDSADVDWNAQSPSDGQVRAAESATQLARQRALANPQAQASSSSSWSSSSAAAPQKVSSPRQNVAAASSQAISKTSKTNNNNNNLSQQTQISQQLQEPFEQIRQVELNGRARKSRHAPFYLFTI